MRIAVIGLTEPGLHLADVLRAAGADVVGFDATPPKYAPVPVVKSVEEAVHDAGIVLVFTAPTLAQSTAQLVAPALSPEAIYADFSASSPETKKKLAEILPPGSFVDAALLSGDTIEASGAAASGFVESMKSLTISATEVSEVPGDVATRMLVRNLFAKSLATAVTDTLWAAQSLGIENWAWEEIQRQFETLNAGEAQDLIDDTAMNFKRHQIEMQDVVELLAGSDYESTMVAPIQFNHGRIMHGKKIPHSQAPRPKWQR